MLHGQKLTGGLEVGTGGLAPSLTGLGLNEKKPTEMSEA